MTLTKVSETKFLFGILPSGFLLYFSCFLYMHGLDKPKKKALIPWNFVIFSPVAVKCRARFFVLTKLWFSFSYCPQFDSIIEVLTGREILNLFADIRGVPPTRKKDEVDKWISFVGKSHRSFPKINLIIYVTYLQAWNSMLTGSVANTVGETRESWTWHRLLSATHPSYSLTSPARVRSRELLIESAAYQELYETSNDFLKIF